MKIEIYIYIKENVNSLLSDTILSNIYIIKDLFKDWYLLMTM